MADKHTPYSLSDWLKYLWHDEIRFLERLTTSLPPNPIIVNIGAGGGTSALTFLSTRPDAFVITVDLIGGITPTGGLENERLILEASEVPYLHRYRAIEGDSKAVGTEWHGGMVNLVFIDGDHSYEGCAGDIYAWMPNLVVGGVVALHDYKKEDAWIRRLGRDISKWELDNIVKPFPGVEEAVAGLLDGIYPRIDVVDSLIAFRKE